MWLLPARISLKITDEQPSSTPNRAHRSGKTPQLVISIAIMTAMNPVDQPCMPVNPDNDAECSRIACPVGSGFRYACLSHRDPERRALAALRALDLTLTEISATQADPEIARRKLDWWRNALHQSSTHYTAEHPILLALLAAITPATLTMLVPHLEARLGGALVELDYQGFETSRDLTAYLIATGGAMYALYADVLKCPVGWQEELRHLGALHHQLHRLTYLGRDVAQGRIYLPAEQLARAGLSETDLHRPNAPETLAPLLRTELTSLEQQWYEAVEQLRKRNPRPPAFFRALIALDSDQLKLLKQNDVRVLERRSERAPFSRLLTAWWAAKCALPKFPVALPRPTS